MIYENNVRIQSFDEFIFRSNGTLNLILKKKV